MEILLDPIEEISDLKASNWHNSLAKKVESLIAIKQYLMRKRGEVSYNKTNKKKDSLIVDNNIFKLE